jgi:hypothetical protein
MKQTTHQDASMSEPEERSYHDARVDVHFFSSMNESYMQSSSIKEESYKALAVETER